MGTFLWNYGIPSCLNMASRELRCSVHTCVDAVNDAVTIL